MEDSSEQLLARYTAGSNLSLSGPAGLVPVDPRFYFVELLESAFKSTSVLNNMHHSQSIVHANCQR